MFIKVDTGHEVCSVPGAAVYFRRGGVVKTSSMMVLATAASIEFDMPGSVAAIAWTENGKGYVWYAPKREGVL